MLSAITKLSKAALAVALSPAAAVADLLTLPASAYGNRPAFRRTSDMLQQAGKLARQVVAADDGGGR